MAGTARLLCKDLGGIVTRAVMAGLVPAISKGKGAGGTRCPGQARA
jgi:hypothetical protein